MVSCFKCGQTDDNDKTTTVFFNIPSVSASEKWHKDFCEILGIDNLDEYSKEHLKICDKHFKTADLEMKDGMVVLKDNSLPIVQTHHIDQENTFFEEKSGLDYFENTNDLGDDESYDTQDLVSLEPLVEYVVYSEDDDSSQVTLENSIEPYNAEQNIQTEVTEANVENLEQIVKEESNVVDPMIPFFLTSPVFTILNESHEEGETIILKIENQDNITNQIIPYKSRILNEADVADLQNQLCISTDEKCSNDYTCEICENTYGCINCLKSHYKTMHVSNTQVMRYKCLNSNNVSKYLYCPVCDLCFNNRTDTMDHYITHSVACEICGCGFDRQLYLTEHMRSVHNKGDYDSIFECVLCTSVYQYAANLSKHYQLYHKMILCQICKLRFNMVQELQNHEKTHWPKIDVLPFACSICNMAFAKTSDIAVHIRLDHTYNGVQVRRDPARKTQTEKNIEQEEFKTVYVIDRSQLDDKNPKPKKMKVRVK